MSRTLENIERAKARKSRVKIVVEEKSKFDNKGKVGNNKVDKDKVRNNKVTEKKNLWKTRKMSKSKKRISSLGFFTPEARLTFTKLR